MKKKNMIVTLLLVLGLLCITIGFTAAFFNYTRTGSENNLRVGKVSFNSTQEGSINLTNVFPMSRDDVSNDLEEGNYVTINITGDTTYNEGVEYLITAESVKNEVNDKLIPVSLIITGTNALGNNDEDYFDNRGGNTSIHKVLSGGVVHEGQYLLVGYIAPGQSGIEGSLNIKAFVDEDLMGISDTYDGNATDEYGTTEEWARGRTIFTTEEWNSLKGDNAISFKIKVEANEGTWVDPYTTPNLMNGVNFNKNAVNIKEIRFIHETPLRMQRRYDASVGQESNGTKMDLTYQDTGKVLAWIEPISVSPTGTNNELLNIKPSFLINDYNKENNIKQIDNEPEYILYIASSGETKWVTGSGLFAGFTNVERITFENVDSSDVTTMSGMFQNLTSLASITGLNRLNTSKVENMSAMFVNNSNLTSIDLSGLGSNVLSYVGGMFSGCTSLTSINMSGFNFGTSNLGGNGYSPFYGMGNIQTINLSNANMSGVTNMSSMFSNCIGLTSIDLSSINMSSVTNMSSMFSSCTSLTSIDLSGLGSNVLSNVINMFSGCTNLASINMGNFNFGLTESLSGQFYGLSSLLSINLHGAKTNNVTNMSRMFYNCSSLTSIDLSGLGSNVLSNVGTIFSGCTNLASINMGNFNFGLTESLSGQFSGLSNLLSINLHGAKANNVTNMSSMFYNCTSLTSIDLLSINMSSVTNISSMFHNCSSLTSIDLSGLGSNVLSDAGGMFTGCTNLASINMSGFNLGTSRFGGGYQFYNASNVEVIDLSNAITTNATRFDFAFDGLTKLKSVNLNGIDTSNQTSFQAMFRNCKSLTSLDLSSFDTTSVTLMIDMFSGCSKLKTIYVSNTWNTNNVTNSSDMFYGCTSLVGGNGTVYDSSKTDKTYARIDTTSTPGYLTLKSA